MKTDDMDEKLKTIFSRMRAEDEANTPSFESCTPQMPQRPFHMHPYGGLPHPLLLLFFLEQEP